MKHLTRSADNGFATAQYLLGKLLYSGELVPININKALEYLLSAAEQADPFAAYLAGKIMLNEVSVKNIKEPCLTATALKTALSSQNRRKARY